MTSSIECLIVNFLTGLFECTPVDILLLQWILSMSLVTNGISRFLSNSWSLLHYSDSTESFLSGLEGLCTYMCVSISL